MSRAAAWSSQRAFGSCCAQNVYPGLRDIEIHFQGGSPAPGHGSVLGIQGIQTGNTAGHGQVGQWPQQESPEVAPPFFCLGWGPLRRPAGWRLGFQAVLYPAPGAGLRLLSLDLCVNLSCAHFRCPQTSLCALSTSLSWATSQQSGWPEVGRNKGILQIDQCLNLS